VNTSDPVSPKSFAAALFGVTRFLVAFFAAFLVARFLGAPSTGDGMFLLREGVVFFVSAHGCLLVRL
jgi:hypothetical protein